MTIRARGGGFGTSFALADSSIAQHSPSVQGTAWHNLDKRRRMRRAGLTPGMLPGRHGQTQLSSRTEIGQETQLGMMFSLCIVRGGPPQSRNWDRNWARKKSA